jgi:hypothetical protein
MSSVYREMLFNQRLVSGEWPINTCYECLRQYWACANCGASPMAGDKEHPPAICSNTYCHGIVPVWKEIRICHIRYSHHVGSQCDHCGLDEVDAKRMTYQGG